MTRYSRGIPVSLQRFYSHSQVYLHGITRVPWTPLLEIEWNFPEQGGVKLQGTRVMGVGHRSQGELYYRKAVEYKLANKAKDSVIDNIQ